VPVADTGTTTAFETVWFARKLTLAINLPRLIARVDGDEPRPTRLRGCHVQRHAGHVPAGDEGTVRAEIRDLDRRRRISDDLVFVTVRSAFGLSAGRMSMRRFGSMPV
jgi:hypothetical protein